MISIDLNGSEPIEDQIRREIHFAIARGTVKRGEALPSVRQLAGDLGVHWNTVARAYRRLRDDGLLTVGRGRAVTVRREEMSGHTNRAERAGDVSARLDDIFTQAKLRGFSFDELRSAVEERMDSWRGAWEEGNQ